MQAGAKGSFSYRNDKIYLMELEPDVLSAKIIRLGRSTAALRFYDAASEHIDIPATVRFVYADDNTAVETIDRSFLITWIESYKLFYNGKMLYSINSQKQQSISCSVGGLRHRAYTDDPVV
jgi:hypothetical protein